MMHRRGFLGLLAAAAAGAVLDPERLLWIPGQRSYFDIRQPAGELPVIYFGDVDCDTIAQNETIDAYILGVVRRETVSFPIIFSPSVEFRFVKE